MKRIIPKNTPPDQLAMLAVQMVQGLDPSRVWCLDLTEWKKPRTGAQNAYLNGVVYPMILEAGGEALRGWYRSDLHEFFLLSYFGSEKISGLGHTFDRALRRSSKLTVAEFSDFLMFIETKCLELGIGPLPEPVYVQA